MHGVQELATSIWNSELLLISWFHNHVQNVWVSLSFSGRPHAPVNMVGSVEEVNASGKGKKRKFSTFAALAMYFVYTPSFCKFLKFFVDFRRLWESRNSQTTAFYINYPPYIYRSMWSARKAKPRFDATL